MNKLAFTVLLTLAAAVAWAEVPAPPTGYQLVFEETFDKDAAERFDFTDPKAWDHAEDPEGNGILSLKRPSRYTPPVRSPLNIAWVKGLELESFVLDVRAKQTGREYGHRDLCLFFGGVDPSHFYYVHLASVADEHANSIFLVNNQPRVSIAEKRTDGTQWTDAYHHIRLVRDGQAGLIEVYFDDMEKPVMTAVDRHFPKGKIGLGSFDDVGNFDDLRIYAKDGALKVGKE